MICVGPFLHPKAVAITKKLTIMSLKKLVRFIFVSFNVGNVILPNWAATCFPNIGREF